MIIRVLEHKDEEPVVLDEIEIKEVNPMRVTPVCVGNSLSIQELKELLGQIQPLEPSKPEEPESYYAQNVTAWRDGSLSSGLLDIPHHIGLRVVLESILQRYSTSNHLLIQIS